MPLLVIGCPRSGTQYISRVLSASGLDVKHEDNGADGKVSWAGAVESIWAGGRHLGKKGVTYDRKNIWHQTREPLSCIASMNVFNKELSEEIWGAINFPKISGNSLATWALFWVYWNKVCESQASRTYRVEDIDFVYPQMIKRLNLPNQPLPKIPRDANTRGNDAKHALITWEAFKETPEAFDLLAEAAWRYGY